MSSTYYPNQPYHSTFESPVNAGRSTLAVRAAEKVLLGVEHDLARARSAAKIQKRQLQKTQTELQDLKNYNQQLEDKLNATTNELEIEKKSKNSIEQATKELCKSRIRQLETELVKTASQCVDMTEQRDEYSRQNAALRKQNEALINEVKTYEDAIVLSKETIKGLEDKSIALSVRYDELERYSKMLEKSSEMLSTDRERWEHEEINREIKVSNIREISAIKVAEANARCLELQKEANSLKSRVYMLEQGLANKANFESLNISSSKGFEFQESDGA